LNFSTIQGAVSLLKGTDSTEAILRAAHQQSPELLLVWRNLGRLIYGQRDCPPDWGSGA
jgi:hypothetical protein